jgi:uncharacterized protein (TIGR00369 family)
MTFDVSDPEFETRVRMSLARQGVNRMMEAILGRVAAGRVEIEVPFTAGVSQQHGFFHGGVMGAIGDSACGYAAMTLTPAGAEVLTIEYKVNFLSPAQGDRLLARGRVVRPGRAVTVCAGEVFVVGGAYEKLVTIMTVGAHREIRTTTNAMSAREEGSEHGGLTSRRWCPCRRLARSRAAFATLLRAPTTHGTAHPSQE